MTISKLLGYAVLAMFIFQQPHKVVTEDAKHPNKHPSNFVRFCTNTKCIDKANPHCPSSDYTLAGVADVKEGKDKTGCKPDQHKYKCCYSKRKEIVWTEKEKKYAKLYKNHPISSDPKNATHNPEAPPSTVDVTPAEIAFIQANKTDQRKKGRFFGIPFPVPKLPQIIIPPIQIPPIPQIPLPSLEQVVKIVETVTGVATGVVDAVKKTPVVGELIEVGSEVANIVVEVSSGIPIVGGLVSGALKGIIGFPLKLVEIGVAIGKIVEEMIERREELAGFLAGLAYELDFKLEEKCNIAIFNMKHWHDNSLQEVIYSTNVEWEKTTFTVFVAKGGKFANLHAVPLVIGMPNFAVAGDYEMDATDRVATFNYRHFCEPLPDE